ncbi:MAG: DMT family transporter [Bacteriovoracaceae bacterium]
MSEWLTYLLVIGANFTFAGGTLIFSHFSKKVSVIWVNTLKALIATFLFAITASVLGVWQPIAFPTLGWLFLSGLIGLCLADILLLQAFTILGPARTLVLFSFQPIILGIAGYFLFGQSVGWMKMLSIVFMIGCLLIFVSERKEQTGKWSLSGFIEAFCAISLDAVGVIFTRLAYEGSSSLHPAESNFYRGIGALVGFFFLHMTWRKIELLGSFKKLNMTQRKWVVLGCVLGCYISLFMYLTALKYSNLATASALSITGPLFAGTFECIVNKSRPSKHLVMAFGMFVLGVIVLSLS